MVRTNRQTYAGCVTIDLKQYEAVHGLIDEFGGRVKQFCQDVRTTGDWYIFFEMAKLQKEEFSKALKEYQDANRR